MDIELFLKAAVVGVPLLFPVWGLVQLFKLFKKPNGDQLINGNVLLLLSFAWGLILGGGYMIFATQPPMAGSGGWYTQYVYWFGVVFYGICIGILASVFWEALKAIVDKTVQKFIAKGTGLGPDYPQ